MERPPWSFSWWFQLRGHHVAFSSLEKGGQWQQALSLFQAMSMSQPWRNRNKKREMHRFVRFVGLYKMWRWQLDMWAIYLFLLVVCGWNRHLGIRLIVKTSYLKLYHLSTSTLMTTFFHFNNLLMVLLIEFWRDFIVYFTYIYII